MTPTGPNAPLPGSGSVDPLRRIDSAKPKGSEPSPQAPAFRALLERLEAQAQELSAGSESVERPEDLSHAAELARESLSGALELRDQLLEAYRQAQSQKNPEPGAGAGGAQS